MRKSLAKRSLVWTLLMVLCLSVTGGLSGALAEDAAFEVWVQPWDTWQQEWLDEWVAAYNEQTDGVTVTVQYVPESTWSEKIKAAQASGTAPDVVAVNLKAMPNEVWIGAIQPLDAYMDEAIWDDVMENYEDLVLIDGQHYGFPYQVEAGQVLFYRKDLFEAAGLDPDTPPKTWADVIDYAQKLTDQYTYGFQLNTDDAGISWTSYALQYNTAGHFAVDDNWERAILTEDAGYADLFEYFKTLHDLGVVPPEALCDPFTTSALCEGSVAMLMTGAWNFQIIEENYPEMMDQIGVAVIPTQEGDFTRASSSIGGWTLAIDANAKYPQEAADFIAWLLGGDPEIMLDFCTRASFGKSSVRKSVAELIAQDPATSENQWLKALNEDILPYAVLEPSYNWNIALAVGQGINRVIVYDQSIEEALAQCEQEINDFIELNAIAGTNPRNQ